MDADEGLRGGGPAAGYGLGPPGAVLRFPEGSLGPSADDQSGGVPLRGGAAPDDGRETLQEGGERDGRHLEDVADRRGELPETERSGADGAGCRGRPL